MYYLKQQSKDNRERYKDMKEQTRERFNENIHSVSVFLSVTSGSSTAVSP